MECDCRKWNGVYQFTELNISRHFPFFTTPYRRLIIFLQMPILKTVAEVYTATEYGIGRKLDEMAWWNERLFLVVFEQPSLRVLFCLFTAYLIYDGVKLELWMTDLILLFATRVLNQ